MDIMGLERERRRKKTNVWDVFAARGLLVLVADGITLSLSTFLVPQLFLYLSAKI